MSEDQFAKLHIRIVTAQKIVLGWGRADLLGLIAETGSIAAAGRRMGMSYKRAWALVETMNQGFVSPLVVAAKGGAGGGGAQLTDMGVEVLAAYREIELLAEQAASLPLSRLAARLKGDH
jgi:molybdate transport system regulatory protein